MVQSDHDQLSASVYSDFSQQDFDCEEQGFSYVVGYVAHKFSKKYPELGYKTCEASIFQKDSSPWITAISKGGLTKPSQNFLSQAKELEILFKQYQGKTIRKTSRLVENFIDLAVQKFPNLPQEVIAKFARTRTYIRIKYLNSQLSREAAARRQSKQLKQFQT